MLTSPSESATFRTMGRSSWRCEDFGADALWSANGILWGVQRKALVDLLASVQDGRLAKEVMQMTSLGVGMFIVETGERSGGWPREVNGQLTGTSSFGRGWTLSQFRGLLWSIQSRGIWVLFTRDEEQTIEVVGELEAWSRKKEHSSLLSRGQMVGGLFGQKGSREYVTWVLQSLPGVGAKMAGVIYDHFGGRVLRLADEVGGVEGLRRVRGVGKVRAEKIVEILGGE